MSKWSKIAPVGIAAAAAGAVAAVLSKKNSAQKAEAKTEKKPAAKNTATGSYSFVSGFMDAATVEVKVKYDPERYSFSVVEDNFIASTSDSHVALVMGADFNAQLEYAPYYSGDDFAKLGFDAKSRNGYAAMGKGFRYVDGDSVYVCLPVDGSSYLLITVMRSKGSKVKFEELPTTPELVELVESVELC